MRTTVKLATTVLIGISLTGVAQGHPKLNCVKDVKFGQAFLAKFPDAGSACQEVKVVQGEKWVRFDAQVKNNKDNRMTVDLLNPSAIAILRHDQCVLTVAGRFPANGRTPQGGWTRSSSTACPTWATARASP